VVGNEPIDLKQLKHRYYVPGLMAKVFSGQKLPDVAAFDNVPMYPEVTLPETMPASGKVAIALRNQGGGIGKAGCSSTPSTTSRGWLATSAACSVRRSARLAPSASR